jgi:hypothetical protein
MNPTFRTLFYKFKRTALVQDTTRYSSQVCRRWRFLLPDFSIIWSRVIDFPRNSHLWTEELLRRAADHPHFSSSLLSPDVEYSSKEGGTRLAIQSI